ncbi:alpha-amylase family protein [Saccharopolyspora taberi]|uniref:Alpha-amylase n=1 Tax=Saccharopolyspora taberi TaxID=60895 RepID=A0ABN3VGA5_9PSEU
MRLKVLAITAVLTGTALVPAAASAAPPEPERGPVTLAGNPTAGPVIQMFQWPWDSLAAECTSSLGPAGFGAVQVSPPQEHVVLKDKGYPWYQDYQPVSYGLDSRRGNAEQFAAMVRTCKDAGVEVYVDAVVNHMSGSGSVGSGPGSGGSEYEKYNYPGLFGDADFHGCRRDIQNYNDKNEVRNCELVGLADLATESEYVRQAQRTYLQGLIDMGVTGFRVDGVKHMPPEDVQAIFGGLTGDPYVFLEVIGDGTTTEGEYTGAGDVTVFPYYNKVANAFKDGSLAQLANLPNEMPLPGEQAVVFIDNHDTQRSSPTLTYKDGARYDLAVGFELAYPYGTPQLISSFAFDNPDAGPPADANGTTSPASCDDQAWVCEHRRPVINGLAQFHKAVAGTELTNWWDNGGGQIAFGRGDAGFAAFNAEGGELTQTFKSALPAGSYCNVAAGAFVGGQCAGETVEVAGDGTFTATVPANGALALHSGAKVG